MQQGLGWHPGTPGTPDTPGTPAPPAPQHAWHPWHPRLREEGPSPPGALVMGGPRLAGEAAERATSGAGWLSRPVERCRAHQPWPCHRQDRQCWAPRRLCLTLHRPPADRDRRSAACPHAMPSGASRVGRGGVGTVTLCSPTASPGPAALGSREVPGHRAPLGEKGEDHPLMLVITGPSAVGAPGAAMPLPAQAAP